MSKLSATIVQSRSLAPGRYQDGKGLFLNVTASGSRSWVVRLRRDGKRRDIGLGAHPAVSLQRARELAAEAREIVASGGNLKDERARARAIPTFEEAARSSTTPPKGSGRMPSIGRNGGPPSKPTPPPSSGL